MSNKKAIVETFDVPDEELGCHHNEICSNCGVDVYRMMKYCYECGCELVWEVKNEKKKE